MDVELSTYSDLDGALVETSSVQRMATGRGFGEGHALKLGDPPRNGRATFAYGEEQSPGQAHIIWRRIGSHDIFRRP